MNRIMKSTLPNKTKPSDLLVNQSGIHLTEIKPVKGWVPLQLAELWQYRDLVYLLVWRDIKVRYKQTVVGSSWAILQPLITMIVFTLLFDKLVKIETGETPYPIFSYSALVPWTFFTHAMTKLSTCLTGNYDLVTKVYFPKLVLPISIILAALVDFIISFIMLLILMVIYGITPGISIITLPLFVIMAVATAFGIGLWLAAVNLQFRDISNAVPFIIQIWMFITPIAYPSSLIPEKWRALYGLNPMAGVVEGFRWALVGSSWEMPVSILATSLFAVAVLLMGGLFFYRRKEMTFAEVA